MRLRRLLRTHAEYEQRLLDEAGTGPVARAGSARLLQLLEDVRQTWTRESEGLESRDLRGHVSRSLASMRAAAAAMARPGADIARLGAELRDAGVPLVFFLRGLDDSDAPALAELTGQGLRRSA